MRKNVYKLCLTLMTCIGLSTYSKAQTSLGTSKNLLNEIKKGISTRQARSVGSADVDLQISELKSLAGKVNFKQSEASSVLLVGEVEGVNNSSFFIKVSDTSLEGHIILKDNKKAYKYYSDASGNAFVEEVNINSLICIDYENKPSKNQRTEAQAREAAAISPALLDLQSFPGAAGVVMLDFDGYYMAAGNYWNSGNPINAAPSGMSDADVRQHWELVSEDYRPFNVNITTSEAVFNSYPRNRRMRVVITPTNTAAPGAGGVAYTGSFNWDNDVPCWVFLTTGKTGGDASAHEIGHTFDLQHDGRSNPDEGYFFGIDGTAWAPIMGAGYYRPIAQWSKGEYRYAKNDTPGILQDDIATIAGSKFGIGFRGDDHSNNTNNATNIDYNSNGTINQKYGVISSEADYDFFSFRTGGGNVNINVNTVGRDGNLHVLLRLYNSAGAEMGTYWNSDPFALNASMNVNLAAGQYYLGVDGTGAGDRTYGGYSAYGSLGSYWITGNIPAGSTVNQSSGLVTTYQDLNYTGFSGGFSVGDYNLNALRALGVADNSITSVKVSEGFKVILYSDDNFTGQSMEITADNGFVGNFNDQVTSLRVRPNGAANLNGVYYLQNKASGLYLDVDGARLDDGAPIRQGSLINATNQQFTLTDRGNGSYSIIAKHSGRGFDVAGISKASGAKIHQWEYKGGANQRFILTPTGNGYYKLIAEHDGMVAEVSTNTNREELHQWWNHGGANAQWKLVSLPQPTAGLVTTYQDLNYTGFSGGFSVGDYNLGALRALGVADNSITSVKVSEGFKIILYFDDNFTGQSVEITSDNGFVGNFNDQVTSLRVRPNGNKNLAGTYNVKNSASGLVMDVWENKTTNEAPIRQGALVAGALNQQFEFVHLGDGLYKILAKHSGKCLDVARINKAEGALIFQYTYYGTQNQNFILVDAGNGTYKLIAEHSGKVVEVSTNNAYEQLHQWWNANQGNSKWQLVPVVVTPGNQSPIVALTSPVNNASYTAPASINIAANASDADGSVAKVQFYNGNTLLSEDVSSPYEYTWSNVSAGTYAITTKVMDNSGAITTTSAISVTVKSVVVVDQCTGATAYVENGGYLAGSLVKNAGVKYECKEWPYSGWCNGAGWAYAPGVGAYWADAWYERGTCTPSVSNQVDETNAEALISPNPATNELRIHLDAVSKVSIYSMQGMEVLSSTDVPVQGSVDISELSSGMYMIKIDTGAKVVTRMLVKN